MIWTVMQIQFRRLCHNRIELSLMFVVPVVFFSVFALIFGKGIGSGATPKVKVVLVDEAASAASQTLAESLRENVGLRFMEPSDSSQALTRTRAADVVRRGAATIAIVLHDGETGVSADLLTDASDQVAPQVVAALVSRELAMAGARAARKGIPIPRQTVRKPGPTDVDFKAVSHSPESPDINGLDADLSPELSGGVQIIDVLGEGKSNPVVSMYAAGIAVMFLLFGATSGGGALLEERENTTLDRLLSTRMTMDQLLLGKWFYLTAVGFVQVCVMFAWGQWVFNVDVRGHLDGFLMMTLVTSSAAAAFGLLLATLCKTRGQLNGLSVILILTMSALGGSMVPRYVMSPRMQEFGLWTFNAWALDGYNKVFWRDLPVHALWPQLGMLMMAGIAFLLVARALAVRWEAD